MSEISDFNSDDSVNDPDYVCEENTPSSSNFLSETSTDTHDLLKDEELMGVNKILFSEEFFKVVEKVNNIHIT